jgi:exopolyphosphatase/guanosine-5'-triphosphate,3'-diphosphate pyrophosphatase
VKAAIDIGTNTALLLVAEIADNKLRIVEEQQRIPRLGAGVDESQNLFEESIERVIDALQDYQQVIENRYPSVSDIYVTATSAVRDAQNQEAFIEQVKQKTGLEVQVLSGFEEAQYTFWGSQSVLNDRDTNGQLAVIDIGGGSTEIAYGSRMLQDRYSYDMGCVRFTERFFKHNPPTTKELNRCRDAIKTVFKEYEFNFADQVTLIGVAGTVTSLACIDKNMNNYNSRELSGYRLPKQVLAKHINQLRNQSSKELEQRYPEVMKGRADIFMAGLLILHEFMSKYDFEALITSTGGIRHGAILNASRK